jgi:hypothetical protein
MFGMLSANAVPDMIEQMAIRAVQQSADPRIGEESIAFF